MHKRDASATRPALIPLFGGHDKKPRLLDRDVITVGRARGCDVILEAPDVSTLHCLIYQTPEGLRIRDCGSRTGTRLNGVAVRNQLMVDEDVVHIGPFSFQFHQPGAGKHDRRPDRSHLERSRRNLAELALKLRRRCQDLATGQGGGDRADLKRREADLKARIRAYDTRANQLEEAERDLEAERLDLRNQHEAQQSRVQKAEEEIARRLEETENAVQARWQEFQARCAVEEQRLDDWSRQLQDEAQRLADATERQEVDGNPAGDAVMPPVEAAETEKQDLARAREQLRRDQEELNRQREDLMRTRDNWTSEERQTAELFDRQRQALVEAEAALKEQRIELGRMMGDLRDLQQAIRTQQRIDVPALQQENAELRQIAAHWRGQAEEWQRKAAEPRLDPDMRSQLDLFEDLKAQVAALESLREDAARLQRENQQTRQGLSEKDQLIAERDRQIQELRRRLELAASPSSATIDLETYETELNQYRKQLDTDRARLNAELEALRQKNSELDEATREMEMELSRERAELARERMRLDRLRDEVKADAERMQRDAGMRESLASVYKLREEMNGKKGPPTESRPGDRLNSLRSQG